MFNVVADDHEVRKTITVGYETHGVEMSSALEDEKEVCMKITCVTQVAH